MGMKYFKTAIQILDRDLYDTKSVDIEQLYDQGVRKNPHLTQEEKKACLYWTKGRFSLNDVVYWYETQDRHTSVILRDGERVIIQNEIEKFDRMMESLSILPYS